MGAASVAARPDSSPQGELAQEARCLSSGRASARGQRLSLFCRLNLPWGRMGAFGPHGRRIGEGVDCGFAVPSSRRPSA
eukprot:6851526-Heterocapsa_arctica.AAC.1